MAENKVRIDPEALLAGAAAIPETLSVLGGNAFFDFGSFFGEAVADPFTWGRGFYDRDAAAQFRSQVDARRERLPQFEVSEPTAQVQQAVASPIMEELAAGYRYLDAMYPNEVEAAKDYITDPRVMHTLESTPVGVGANQLGKYIAKDITQKTANTVGDMLWAGMVGKKTSPVSMAVPDESILYPMADRGKWYSHSDYESAGGKLKTMSPQEFLDNAKTLDIDDVSRENIDDLKRHITDGGELDPLSIYGDKSNVRNSDGRHRAVAALELGIDEVPVIDFRKPETVGDALVVQHNLSQDNVKHAEKMGGLAAPSIAIAKAERPIDGYGDVTLLGDQSMVKPSARNPVYSADAYTPRYPNVETKLSDADSNKLRSFAVEPFGVDSKDYAGMNKLPVSTWGMADDIERKGLAGLKDSDAMKARFLWERGELPDHKGVDEWDFKKALRKKIGYDGDVYNEFTQWVDNIPDRLGIEPQERLFKGYTQMGNRRYAPHTLDNVIKEMRRELRGADGGANIYGAGALRAHVAPKFRSLQEIKDARSRIKSREDMEAFKEATNDKLSELSHKLTEYSNYKDPNPFTANGVTIERMVELAQGYDSWSEYFPGVPDDLKKEVLGYFDELRKAPTEYFEAKPIRAVDVGEFNVALIPEGADPKVQRYLKDKGLKIEVYKDTADRNNKIKAQRDLLFSLMAGAVGLGVVANSSQGT